jgi:hypothetical protein
MEKAPHDQTSAKRGRWTKDPAMFWVTLAGVLAVIAYTSVAAWQASLTSEQVIADRRAWLAPRVATFGKELGLHEPWSITVAYGNVGKEPALNFAAGEEFGSVPSPKPNESWYTVFPTTTLKYKCGLPSDDGLTIYPSGPIEHRYTVDADARTFDITQDILDGTKIMFMHGCFVYDTVNTPHASEYCFLLVPLGDHSILSEDQKRRPDSFRSTSCMYGNHAT